MNSFLPSSLAGRVALVTGANTGIGMVTASELAARGAHVFIACRSADRANPALERIRSANTGARVELLPLDLGDFDAIRQCARMFLSRGLPLHLLINNAGLGGQTGRTRSGFELAFGVNHIGPFLLTHMLLERLRESAPARIVTVSSRAHYRSAGLDWEAVRRPTVGLTGLAEYAASKLANVLFSAELGRRLAGTGVTTYALHPGVVATDIWRRVPWPFSSLMKLGMISAREGAQTTLHCACSADVALETGLYYDNCRTKTPSHLAQDPTLAAELWTRSDAWVRAG